ncbi:polysaccharide deacetylase family protein [Galbibacter sp. PAP.153]|uniref:polysaccharide deacetylase family protein n=1 Tax=Galbibacter sp. PAP.153 TaxID=3104623 RepID=UPI00300BF29F
MLKYRTVNIVATLLILIAAVANYIIGSTPWTIGVIAICWLLLTVIGSFHVRWNYHINHYNKNGLTKRDIVSITFDDGPNPDFTPQIISILKKYKAKATFFCVGEQVKKHPEILKKIISEGHTIGNHTYSHAKNFGFFSTNKVVDELNRTNTIVKEITGLNMKMYRPVYGVTNPHIKKALKTTKHHPVGWSIRSLDTTGISSNAVYSRITTRINKGDIILLHDTNLKTIEVLERLLLFLTQKGIQSVSVDSLLKINAYDN